MRLHELLTTAGMDELPSANPTVAGVTDDCRCVGPGHVFVAVTGSRVDGRSFVDSAIRRGAVAIVATDLSPDGIPVPVVGTENSRLDLARLCAAYHGHPSRDLLSVGITGTNGKTTTSWLVRQILEDAGTSCGLLGTIRYDTGRVVKTAPLTTPPAPILQENLAGMRESGCGAVVMEVSSHALSQHRAHGVEFDVCVVTNISHDHLDYHGDMEKYAAAKSGLLDLVAQGGTVVLNRSDDRYRYFRDRVPAGVDVLSFSCEGHEDADFRAQVVDRLEDGSRIALEGPWGRRLVRVGLIGRHNIENLLAAIASAWAVGVSPTDILGSLGQISAPPGRLERVDIPVEFSVLVDYAHTPDALEVVLGQLRPLVPERLICVFGCGGDRDRRKRSEMGRIAERLADRVVLTSDNPRTEEPGRIVTDILSGMSQPEATKVVMDRRTAIRSALEDARSGDWVLLAGKGHEKHQKIDNRREEHDDRNEVVAWFEARGGAA